MDVAGLRNRKIHAAGKEGREGGRRWGVMTSENSRAKLADSGDQNREVVKDSHSAVAASDVLWQVCCLRMTKKEPGQKTNEYRKAR